jgi:hypothetical protein
VTLDDPRREPDAAAPPHEPEPDPGIRPDGYLVEPPFAEPHVTPEVGGAQSWQPSPAAGAMSWPDGPDGTEEPEKRRVVVRERGRYLGVVAFILAALLFGTNVVGIVLSNTGSDELALNIAYITIFGTILTFVGGFVAAVLNFGRVWGVAAVVLSVLGNPFVLVVLLGSFTGAVR